MSFLPSVKLDSGRQENTPTEPRFECGLGSVFGNLSDLSFKTKLNVLSTPARRMSRLHTHPKGVFKVQESYAHAPHRLSYGLAERMITFCMRRTGSFRVCGGTHHRAAGRWTFHIYLCIFRIKLPPNHAQSLRARGEILVPAPFGFLNSPGRKDKTQRSIFDSFFVFSFQTLCSIGPLGFLNSPGCPTMGFPSCASRTNLWRRLVALFGPCSGGDPTGPLPPPTLLPHGDRHRTGSCRC